MESIEAIALKSSFLLKTANSKTLYNDDVWCLTGINSAAAAVSDDFPVEDLLNLDFPEIELQEENDGLSQGNSKVSSSSSSSFSGADEFDCLSAGELTVPDSKAEDLENLEWLSRIVDDSMSEHSMVYPAGSFACLVNRTGGTKTGIPSFDLSVCRKPRSKRSRTNGRLWLLASPPLSAADSTSTTSSSNGSTGLPPVRFVGSVHDAEPPSKRQRRKTEADLGRRCTHCLVQRTPQWRTGPLGPKTLCNACGVRFKSGRLYPEYRPACSPTFSQEVHSNSHRKVLEMRRRKEEPGSRWAVQAQTVGSF